MMNVCTTYTMHFHSLMRKLLETFPFINVTYDVNPNKNGLCS